MCKHMDLVDALLEVGHNTIFAVDMPVTALVRLGFDQTELAELGAISVAGDTFRVNRFQTSFEETRAFAETPRGPVGTAKRGRGIIGGGGSYGT